MDSRKRSLLPLTLCSALLGSVLALTMSATAPEGAAASAMPRQPDGSASASASPPEVWPPPRSLKQRSGAAPVTIPRRVVEVVGANPDAAALRVLNKALRDAGVTRIERVQADQKVPPAPLTVYVGGPSANQVTADALNTLGVRGPGELPAEGYVLATGRADSVRQSDPRGERGSMLVLAGADATGTFYAAQTLRQLVTDRGDAAQIPAVTVRDWPAMKLRGVIEGFYGQPWSHRDRLAQLDFYGRTKQNIYVYSPKDDPYLREKWRKPYPADQLATIKELVDRARANHVEFTYALSPGLSICYSSEEDLRALVAKFEAMWEIGVRSYAIPLDDISYTDWNCKADEEKFGTGPAAAGQAQAYILNQVQQAFVEPHEDNGIARLQTVPTEYYDVSESPYKRELRENLSDKVIVEWTGVGVIAPVITTEQAKAAKDVFGHDILVWDNYPVNDYVQDRLLLGPYVGREAGIAEHLVGVTANPMNQAEASKIALFTSAAFMWNPETYEPKQAWLTALHKVGGDAWKWLKVLAENSYSSRLQDSESLTLTPLIEDFWTAYESEDNPRQAAGKLRDYLAVMASTPEHLRAELDNAALVDEVSPWLDKLGLYGQAGQHAVRMLLALRDGDGEAAWAQRAAMKALLERAHAIRTPVSGVEPRVAPGVFSPFAQRALDEFAQRLGIVDVSATTSLGTYGGNAPENMVDDDPGTFYWSNGAPSTDDYVGVDLGARREITGVQVTMSKESSPDDYIHTGVLEISTDGENWTSLGEFSGQRVIEADVPAGTTARYVRLRATAEQDNWVVVREFAVATADDTELTVSGAPPAAEGSTLAAAADGDLDSTYIASRKPRAGEAVTVSFGRGRQVDSLLVLQDHEQTASAVVRLRTGEGWQSVGSLDGGHTRLTIDGVDEPADAIRLRWDGTQTPVIHEVVPKFADQQS